MTPLSSHQNQTFINTRHQHFTILLFSLYCCAVYILVKIYCIVFLMNTSSSHTYIQSINRSLCQHQLLSLEWWGCTPKRRRCCSKSIGTIKTRPINSGPNLRRDMLLILSGMRRCAAAQTISVLGCKAGRGQDWYLQLFCRYRRPIWKLSLLLPKTSG